jgi:predicted phosphodiesterase
MRLAVLADTHGNLPALEAVLADVEERGVNGFLIAGDITGGPQAGETVVLLRSLQGWMIRGNGEEYLLDYRAGRAPASWYAHEQWATLRWSYQRLEPEVLDLIDRLSDEKVARPETTGFDPVTGSPAPIRMVHGSPWSTREFLYPDRDLSALDAFRRAGLLPQDRSIPRLEALLAAIEEPVLVCAHSHIPWVQENEALLVVNPGSVGAPNNGDPRAQYAILTWTGGRWQAELRQVRYDLDQIRAAYRDTGYLAAGGVMARAFLLGIVTGENVPGLFVASVRRLASEAGCQPYEPLPDAVWQEAIVSFDWGTDQGAGPF